MSINDQFTGWRACRLFAMREDIIHPESQQDRSQSPRIFFMAQIFLLLSTSGSAKRTGGAAMTTLRQIELRCPVCDNEFKSQSVVSTNAFGGKRTDFPQVGAGSHAVALSIR